jgi:hypothetical protein
MLKQMPKEEYLLGLQARHDHNCQIVATVFVPLDQTQRSWQPAPDEWSVDQCFQHLIVSFAGYVTNIIPALNKPEPPHAERIYRPSFWARRLHEWQFDPGTKLSALKRFNPPAASIPDVLARYLAQQDRLADMIAQAAQADLQTMCWFFKGLPIRNNLGDYLNFFIAHDELHIDQAQRVLSAYRETTVRVNAAQNRSSHARREA